jgi:dienelactone hydrolase
MRARTTVTVCVLLAMSAVLSACSSSKSHSGSGAGTPSSSKAATSTSTSTPSGPPYKVEQITLSFVDGSRPTPRNGTYPGASSRTLVTVVSLPVGAAPPVPLVVFSTGIDGTATNYEGLYRHWVEAGYAVAAPVFPLSNAHAPGGSTIADFASQPGDVRFVLTQLLRASAATTGRLAGRLDPTRVALAGKSLGALTTLRTAYLVSDHETREKAVISLTGGGNGSNTFFTGIKVPLLLVHGDADRTVPYQSSVTAFETAERPKYLVTLFGQDHGGAFDGEPNTAAHGVEAVTLDFLDEYLRNDPAAAARLTRDATVAHVASIRSAPPPAPPG